MIATLKITNVYVGDGEIEVTLPDVELPDLYEGDEDHEAWAEDHLFPYTGTGRESGDASYFVEVLNPSDPRLEGRTFEWGV